MFSQLLRTRKQLRASIGTAAMGLSVCTNVAFADTTLRDPTQPLVPSAEPGVRVETSDLVLKSVLVSKRRKLAIINGQRLSEGDELNGFRIRTISGDGVMLSKDGNDWLLQRTATTGITKRQG